MPQQRKSQDTASATPELLLLLLCSRSEGPSAPTQAASPLSFFIHLLHSLLLSVLYGSFSIRLQGRLAGNRKVHSQMVSRHVF